MGEPQQRKERQSGAWEQLLVEWSEGAQGAGGGGGEYISICNYTYCTFVHAEEEESVLVETSARCSSRFIAGIEKPFTVYTYTIMYICVHLPCPTPHAPVWW